MPNSTGSVNTQLSSDKSGKNYTERSVNVEAIIKRIKGSEIIAKECNFCSSTKDISTVGFITSRQDGDYTLKFFGLCSDHLEALDKVFSGEFDINNINFVPKVSPQLFANLRLR